MSPPPLYEVVSLIGIGYAIVPPPRVCVVCVIGLCTGPNCVTLLADSMCVTGLWVWVVRGSLRSTATVFASVATDVLRYG